MTTVSHKIQVTSRQRVFRTENSSALIVINYSLIKTALMGSVIWVPQNLKYVFRVPSARKVKTTDLHVHLPRCNSKDKEEWSLTYPTHMRKSLWSGCYAFIGTGI